MGDQVQVTSRLTGLHHVRVVGWARLMALVIIHGLIPLGEQCCLKTSHRVHCLR